MGTIIEKLNYLLETKQANIDALREKGVDVLSEATFRDQADLIRSIKTGGKLKVGTIEPSGMDTTLEPDDGYDGFSKVKVSGDPNLTGSNIRQGVTIFGVIGTFDGGIGGTGNGLKDISITPTGRTIYVTPEEENCDGFKIVEVQGDEALKPENIVRGARIYGVDGTASGGDAVLKVLTVVPTGKYLKFEPADRNCDGFSRVEIVSSDTLKPENIRKDVSIYGVKGTYEGSGGSGSGGGVTDSGFELFEINTSNVNVSTSGGSFIDTTVADMVCALTDVKLQTGEGYTLT